MDCRQLQVPGVTSFTLGPWRVANATKLSRGLRAVLEREWSPMLIITFLGAIITGVLVLAVLEWLVRNWDVVLLGAV